MRRAVCCGLGAPESGKCAGGDGDCHPSIRLCGEKGGQALRDARDSAGDREGENGTGPCGGGPPAAAVPRPHAGPKVWRGDNGKRGAAWTHCRPIYPRFAGEIG